MRSSELTVSRLVRSGSGAARASVVIRELGIEHVKGQGFWQANEGRLHFIYHDFEKAARKLLAAEHPDAGGDGEEFVALNKIFIGVKRAFNRRGVPQLDAVGHERRAVAARRCGQSQKEALRRYRAKNPEKVRAWNREQQRRYRERHPERCRAKERAYRAKRKERMLEAAEGLAPTNGYKPPVEVVEYRPISLEELEELRKKAKGAK